MRAIAGGALVIGLLLSACGGGAGGDSSGGADGSTGSTGGTGSGGSQGTSPGPGGPPAGGTPSASPSPAPQRCEAGELRAEVRAAGAAAGNRYATLVLTNTSGRTCTLRGYGGLQLADARLRPIPTRQVRDPAHPPALVRLAPGGNASAVLHWGAVPGADEPDDRPCEPEPAVLLVIPPDDTAQITARWTGGPVCQHGMIDQRAYAPGIVTP